MVKVCKAEHLQLANQTTSDHVILRSDDGSDSFIVHRTRRLMRFEIS